MVHFDYEKVKAYFDNDKIILKGFLTLLQKELPKSEAELEKSFADKDLEGIVEAAHKLKGTSLSAGLNQLTSMATKLNKLTVFDETLISGLINALVKEVAIILPLVQEKRKDLA